MIPLSTGEYPPTPVYSRMAVVMKDLPSGHHAGRVVETVSIHAPREGSDFI